MTHQVPGPALDGNFWLPSKATQECCQRDVRCTDHMSMGEKIERFENHAACEKLSVDAAKVGGLGILGQCVNKGLPKGNSLRTPATNRMLDSMRTHQAHDSGVAPRTTLAVKVPAHRGQPCSGAEMHEELRPSDCIGPDCRCPPTTLLAEECQYEHLGPCNCMNQCAHQVGLETALKVNRYDVEGNHFCTCQENHTPLNLPDRPQAAYKGIYCGKCTKPFAVERPTCDPAIPQQAYVRYDDRLTRVPPPSCPCSLVKPVVAKESPVPTNNFVNKWAMYETGAAFEAPRMDIIKDDCEVVKF